MREAGFVLAKVEVKVGVHQGSVISPMLFIIVLEALSRAFWAGVPCADYLGIIADSLEECVTVPRRYFFYVFVLSCVSYFFVRVCLYVPCDHLLGKG